MSARLSKEIIDCTEAGRFLLSAFEVEGPRLAAGFLEETGPYLDDGDEPRPDSFLTAVARRLEAASGHLIETDFAVANAAGLESELRHRTKEAKRHLAFLIVALRRMVLAQYVEPDMANLALEPVNVRDTPTILGRAELVGERFEAENLAKMLGQPRFESPVDLGPYVDEIRRHADELLTLVAEVNTAQRATDRARRERKKAKETYDRLYLRGARIFEDLCRFSGLEGLAAKVRRRKGRTSSEATGIQDEGPFERVASDKESTQMSVRQRGDEEPDETRTAIISSRPDIPAPIPRASETSVADTDRPITSDDFDDRFRDLPLPPSSVGRPLIGFR